MILLLALTMARPVSAEEFGTFVRASARVDVSGRTELVIHKAYAGQMGSIRDVISMQNAGPDGYPKVEIATSGAIQATRGNGGIVVESTGPGLGEIDVYVTFNGLRSTWWLQAGEVPGVGAVRLNATAVFGDGLHAAKQGNHVAVRGVDGHETTIIDDGAHGNAWSTNATIPAGSIVLFDIAGEPDRVAPLWMTLTSLGLALISLALSGYLALKLRSATSLRNPSK
jgi:hypothetical protein